MKDKVTNLYQHDSRFEYLYIINKYAHKTSDITLDKLNLATKKMSNVTGGGGALVLRIMTQLIKHYYQMLTARI